MVTTQQPTAGEQIQNYYDSHNVDMVETMINQTGEEVNSQARFKEMPRHRVFHLQYDANGKVIDYHEDHFRCDLNSLSRKMSRRYKSGEPGAGKPVWVLRLPEGVVRQAQNVICSFPGCPATFRSEAERDLHQRAFHRDWYELQRGEADRARREEEMALLREQNRSNQELVASLKEQNTLLLEALKPLLAERKGRGGKE